MLQFQPPGFGDRVVATSLGAMVYYTSTAAPWPAAAPESVPLLFLHSLGGGSSAYEWSKVYPAFAATHRVIAPDLIGWGRSSHPCRRYQIHDYLSLIEELLQQTTRRPAIVFAASLTAGLVVQLAIEQPDRFERLLLVSPSGYSDFGNSYRDGLAAQLAAAPALDRVIYALGAANPLAVRTFLQQVLFAERSRVTEEMVAAYLASAQQPDAEYAALSSLRGDLCFDLAPLVPQLQTPTVFFWGGRSRFSSAVTGQRLAGLNPAVVQAFHCIPDAGVLPHLETPATLIGLVQPYLRV